MYLSVRFLTYLCFHYGVRHILMRAEGISVESNERSDFYKRTDIRMTFPEDTTPISAARGSEQPQKSSTKENVLSFGARNF